MTPDDLDLTPLRPADARGAEERVVAAVLSRIRAGAEREDPLTLVARLATPALAAAAAVVVVAGLVLVRARTEVAHESAPAAPTAAAALGLTAPLAQWAAHPGELPTVAEISAALGGQR